MLAALQGRTSSPSHVNPYSGLHHPRITSRCAHVRSCIGSLPLKDLHEFFPYLLASIFGFDHTHGWHLRSFNQKLHTDFQQLLQFFSPGGDLFQLIAKLESGHYLYEFPINCLPRPSQHSLMEGTIPPLYSDKVNHYSPTQVLLRPFEYYIFHFAYYLVFTQTKGQALPAPAPVSDSLYTHLLETYLQHFLPPAGTLPPALTTSQQQGSPQHQGNTPPTPSSSSPSSLHTPHHPTPGLLRLNGGGEFKMISMVTEGDQKQAPLVQAEVVVQVLIEFWLNQNTYNGRQGDIIAHAQNQFVPNEEHLLLVRRLMKHIHYFSNGSSSPTPLTTLLPLTEALRRSILPTFIQKQLFYFLRYSFRHSPLDNNFRYILELWLTYIQPWRYTDPLKASSENKESLEAVPSKWRGFVLDNFAFFSSLLMEIIGRSFQLDLTNDPGTTLLFRVTKVFSQPELMEFVNYGESLLLNSDTTAYSSPRKSPVIDACSIKALFIDLDGPMFHYQPVFDSNTLEAVQALLDKIRLAKTTVSSRASIKNQHPPASPLPPMPVTPVQPSAPQSKKSWWSTIGDIFSEGPSFPSTPPSPTQSTITDPLKLISMLENTELNLTTMFKRSPHPPQFSPTDGSPHWIPAHQPSITPLNLATPTSHPHPQTPQPLGPEYVKGTTQLTPRGKMQLMQGLHKNSNLQVPYMGDPVLQPIRSYENATLVRCLYRISSHLNERFASQLHALGGSNSVISRTLKHFLSPPPPSAHYPILPDTSEPPHTPKSKVSQVVTMPPSSSEALPSSSPRINLRPLASYYTLCCLILALLLLWILLVPLWLMVVIIIFFATVYFLCSCVFHQKNLKGE